MSEPSFYVGYFSRAPRLLARFVAVVVVALIVFAAGLAAVLSSAQDPFANSSFEYGQYRSFRGVIVEKPVPLLVRGSETWVLAGLGKHGADVRGFDGRPADVRGSLITHGRDRMIEISSIEPREPAAKLPEIVPLGPVRLIGEIVDAKCYFGVMNPGSGKVHRDCAVRCISGGLPAALLVRDATGSLSTVVLAGASEVNLTPHLLPLTAERVSVSGQLYRIGDRAILETEPARIVRE
jgi:hypothetical protein